jgi:hypothetical protein
MELFANPWPYTLQLSEILKLKRFLLKFLKAQLAFKSLRD